MGLGDTLGPSRADACLCDDCALQVPSFWGINPAFGLGAFGGKSNRSPSCFLPKETSCSLVTHLFFYFISPPSPPHFGSFQFSPSLSVSLIRRLQHCIAATRRSLPLVLRTFPRYLFFSKKPLAYGTALHTCRVRQSQARTSRVLGRNSSRLCLAFCDTQETFIKLSDARQIHLSVLFRNFYKIPEPYFYSYFLFSLCNSFHRGPD